MIVPINVATFSSNSKLPPGLAKISHDEVVLIELQGSLEVECTHITESDGKLVGKLKIDESNNKPTLLIGHHLLEGKIMTLAKPLAVLYRPPINFSNRAHEATDVTDVSKMDVDDHRKSKDPTAWDIVAIVKRKVVFSKRPMPVVARATP